MSNQVEYPWPGFGEWSLISLGQIKLILMYSFKVVDNKVELGGWTVNFNINIYRSYQSSFPVQFLCHPGDFRSLTLQKYVSGYTIESGTVR